MGPGWIKFYRKTFEKEQPQDNISRWVWLLCAAEFDGDYRGQFVTTVTSIGEAWGISRHSARRILLNWQNDERITIEQISEKDINHHACSPPSPFAKGRAQSSTQKGVIVSIINYERYQGGDANSDAETAQSSLIPCPEEKEKNTRAKKKKEPQTQHQIAVDFFYTEYEKRFNRKYVGQVKDFAAISRLLKKMSLGDLKLRILQYLRDDDPFLVNNGHSIALIQTRINAYGAAPQKDERSDVGYLKQTY